MAGTFSPGHPSLTRPAYILWQSSAEPSQFIVPPVSNLAGRAPCCRFSCKQQLLLPPTPHPSPLTPNRPSSIRRQALEHGTLSAAQAKAILAAAKAAASADSAKVGAAKKIVEAAKEAEGKVDMLPLPLPAPPLLAALPPSFLPPPPPPPPTNSFPQFESGNRQPAAPHPRVSSPGG